MKRFGLAVFSLALVFALATGVEAQVKTGGKNESARAITISGSLDFTFVSRNEGINEVLDNEYQRNRANGTTNQGRVEKDNFTQLYFNLRFDVELAEKVSAVIELENRILQDGLAPIPGQATGRNAGVGGGTGTQANTGLLGSQGDFGISLGQAYIEVKEFLWQQLSFKLGIQDHRYDLRGNGNAFFMDMRESELAFARPVTEAFAGNIYFGSEVPASVANSHGGQGGHTTPVGDTAGGGDSGLFRDQNRETGGIKFTYNLDDNLFVDLFYFQVTESSAGGALPTGLAVVGATGGVNENEDRHDEYVIGMNIDYNIDEKSLLNFIYAGIYGDDGHVNVHTLGIGIDYYITPEFEAYLEFYGQWGTYGHVSYEGLTVDGTVVGKNNDDDIDQEAYAGIVGFKYTFDASVKPWIDMSYTYISGDSGNISGNGSTRHPHQNHDFVSYEDNDATMILEENHFGLDIDSNYSKFQTGLGMTTSLDRQDDFKLETDIAWAWLNHVPGRTGIGPLANNLFDDAGGDHNGNYGDLGVEWDIKMTWAYSESLSFDVGFGWLFTSKDDFWHGDGSERTGSTGGPGIGATDGYGLNGGEDMWLLTIGTKLRF